jgi:hypothetical protein
VGTLASRSPLWQFGAFIKLQQYAATGYDTGERTPSGAERLDMLAWNQVMSSRRCTWQSAAGERKELGTEDLRALTLLMFQHVTLDGRSIFDMTTRLPRRRSA